MNNTPPIWSLPKGKVSGNRLRILNRAAVLQIRGDPRRPEGVTAGGVGKSRRQIPPLDHPDRIGL